MSIMKLAAALFAIALAIPGNAIADEDQWYCMAIARGAHDSDVIVAIQLTTSGSVLSRHASWRPPILDAVRPLRPYFVSPDVTLIYGNAQSGSLGEVTAILLRASTLGGPRVALRGKQVSFSIDASGPWLVELPARGLGPDYFIGPHRFIQRSAYLDLEQPIAIATYAA